VTQFLEAVLQELPDWRQSLNPFPVLSWPAFIAYLHQAVNPLAGDEHLKVSLRRLLNFSFFFISPFLPFLAYPFPSPNYSHPSSTLSPGTSISRLVALS
jgi:hypothetical protein